MLIVLESVNGIDWNLRGKDEILCSSKIRDRKKKVQTIIFKEKRKQKFIKIGKKNKNNLLNNYYR